MGSVIKFCWVLISNKLTKLIFGFFLKFHCSSTEFPFQFYQTLPKLRLNPKTQTLISKIKVLSSLEHALRKQGDVRRGWGFKGKTDAIRFYVWAQRSSEFTFKVTVNCSVAYSPFRKLQATLFPIISGVLMLYFYLTVTVSRFISRLLTYLDRQNGNLWLWPALWHWIWSIFGWW